MCARVVVRLIALLYLVPVGSGSGCNCNPTSLTCAAYESPLYYAGAPELTCNNSVLIFGCSDPIRFDLVSSQPEYNGTSIVDACCICPSPSPSPPSPVAGCYEHIVDDKDLVPLSSITSGSFRTISTPSETVAYDLTYLISDPSTNQQCTIRYDLQAIVGCQFELFVYYTALANREDNVPITVYGADANTTVVIDMSVPEGFSGWRSLGTFDLGPGSYVEISTPDPRTSVDAGGQFKVVVADAIKAVPIPSISPSPSVSITPSLTPSPRDECDSNFTRRDYQDPPWLLGDPPSYSCNDDFVLNSLMTFCNYPFNAIIVDQHYSVGVDVACCVCQNATMSPTPTPTVTPSKQDNGGNAPPGDLPDDCNLQTLTRSGFEGWTTGSTAGQGSSCTDLWQNLFSTSAAAVCLAPELFVGTGGYTVLDACCLCHHVISPSVSPSASISPSPTPSTTPTPESQSLTPSLSPSLSSSPSITPSITQTPSITPSITQTPSITPSVTPSPSVSPSISPTSSVTPTISPTSSTTPPPSTSASVSPSNTQTPTNFVTKTAEDADIVTFGSWLQRTSSESLGSYFLYSTPSTDEERKVRFPLNSLPSSNNNVYNIDIWFVSGPTRSTAVPVKINHAGKKSETIVYVDQTVQGGQWISIGQFSAPIQYVDIVAPEQESYGSVSADGIRVVDVGELGTGVLENILRQTPSASPSISCVLGCLNCRLDTVGVCQNPFNRVCYDKLTEGAPSLYGQQEQCPEGTYECGCDGVLGPSATNRPVPSATPMALDVDITVTGMTYGAQTSADPIEFIVSVSEAGSTITPDVIYTTNCQNPAVQPILGLSSLSNGYSIEFIVSCTGGQNSMVGIGFEANAFENVYGDEYRQAAFFMVQSV